MLTTDYHVHTAFSSDCETDMEDMIKSAIAKGITEIAFTDHIDYDERYNNVDYNDYMITFNNLKEKYSKKIKLICGVEIGLDNTLSDKINQFTAQFDFDFIIGSSHAVLGYDLYLDDFFSGKSKAEAFGTYFDEALKNIRSTKDFCVYGHLDFLNRYSHYEDNELLYSDFKEVIDTVLRELINQGKGIEINTSGFRYGISRVYPQLDIIKRYRALGGEIITVGSDSHRPADIAANFCDAVEALEQSGFDYITIFRGLKPKFVKIF